MCLNYYFFTWTNKIIFFYCKLNFANKIAALKFFTDAFIPTISHPLHFGSQGEIVAVKARTLLDSVEGKRARRVVNSDQFSNLKQIAYAPGNDAQLCLTFPV